MKLVLFDLDDTLFDGDTEGEWVTYMDNNGLINNQTFFNQMENFGESYRKGELDVMDYSEFLLSPVKGMSLKELEEPISVFTDSVVNKLTDDLTKKLLKEHQDNKKILTSGSLSFLVHKIANHLGIKDSFGTDPEFLHGKFTGKVSGTPNFSEEKVRRIKSWIGSSNFEKIYAYSDSIHDLPLLKFSDVPVAVNPDQKLRKEAEDNCWLIEDTRIS